jgi:fatty-acyl-CoA synthase
MMFLHSSGLVSVYTWGMAHFNPINWLGTQRWLALVRHFRGNAEFLVAGEQRLTCRQIFDRVERLAASLRSLGIRKGDRLATLFPTSPEAVYALFLPWALGTWEVPLNPLLREHELEHILRDSGVKAIISPQRWYGQDYPDMLSRLRPSLPEFKHLIIASQNQDEGLISLDDLLATGQLLGRENFTPAEIGRITYTSGTTGLSKGVVHTWDRYWGLLHPSALPHLDPRMFRSVLFLFPLCYYHGLLITVATLLAGGKMILMDRFHPRQVLETIEREKVTLLAAAPTMYQLILRTPGQENYDLSSVRRIFFGTEICSAELAEAIHHRFGCSLENMYATNETGVISWMSPHDFWQRAATTVGKPASGVRVRIVDDQRSELPIEQIGEIAVKTTQMMLGYHNDPQLTARFLDIEGWFYTGDLGYLGADGYLRLTGRKKDVIVRGGQKIYPEEVENYLEQHPLIRRAGVVGVPGGLGGEVVWAYLELYSGAKITSKDVFAYCRGQIAPFKIPEQIRLIERLPLTVTQKVQRFKLRAMAIAE